MNVTKMSFMMNFTNPHFIMNFIKKKYKKKNFIMNFTKMNKYILLPYKIRIKESQSIAEVQE